MNKLFKTLLVSVFAIVSSCSCSEQSKLNKEAEMRAEEAVAVVLSVDSVKHGDEFAMEQAILEVKAMQSEYDLAGQSEQSEAFRTTFEETLRERAPKLASQILGVEQ